MEKGVRKWNILIPVNAASIRIVIFFASDRLADYSLQPCATALELDAPAHEVPPSECST